MAVRQIAIALGIAYITWCLSQYSEWKKQRGSPRSDTQNVAKDDSIHPALYLLSFPFALVYATIKGLLYVTRTLVMHSLLFVEETTPRFASWFLPKVANFCVYVFEAASHGITMAASTLGKVKEPFTAFVLKAFYVLILAPGMWLFDTCDFLLSRIYMAVRKFAIELYDDAIVLCNVLAALFTMIADKGLLPALAFAMDHAIAFSRSIVRTIYSKRHAVAKRLIEGVKNLLQQLVILQTTIIEHPASQWIAANVTQFLRIDTKKYWPWLQVRLEYCAFELISSSTREIRDVSVLVRRIVDLGKSASPQLLSLIASTIIHATALFHATIHVATKITRLLYPVALQLHAIGRAIFLLIQKSHIDVVIIKTSSAIASVLLPLMRVMLRTSTILIVKAANLGNLAWQQVARHATYLDKAGKHVTVAIERSIKALDWAVVKIGEEIASAAKSS